MRIRFRRLNTSAGGDKESHPSSKTAIDHFDVSFCRPFVGGELDALGGMRLVVLIHDVL